MKMVTNKINVGDTVYYRGFGYIAETNVFDIKGDKLILNNGMVRRIDDLGRDGTDIYLDKEEANRSIAGSYRGRPLL